MSSDVVEAVLVCLAESVSPHELVQITGQLVDCLWRFRGVSLREWTGYRETGRKGPGKEEAVP